MHLRTSVKKFKITTQTNTSSFASSSLAAPPQPHHPLPLIFSSFLLFCGFGVLTFSSMFGMSEGHVVTVSEGPQVALAHSHGASAAQDQRMPERGHTRPR